MSFSYNKKESEVSKYDSVKSIKDESEYNQPDEINDYIVNESIIIKSSFKGNDFEQETFKTSPESNSKGKAKLKMKLKNEKAGDDRSNDMDFDLTTSMNKLKEKPLVESSIEEHENTPKGGGCCKGCVVY